MKNIRRLVIILLTLLLLPALSSCDNTRNTEPFSAFSGDIRADVRLTLGESSSVSVFTRIGETETVAFSEPNELSGYVFKKLGDKITLSYGDLSAEVNSSVGRIAIVSSALFAPETDGISSISAREQDGEFFTEIVCGDITYRFLKDGTPIGAEGEVLGVHFCAEILSIGGAE